MPFQKGNSGNPAGKPKGATNKTTKELREIFQKIIEKNIKTLSKDLQAVGPETRIKLLIQMAEFVLPKLQRTEISGYGDEQNEESKDYVILSNGEKIEF